MQSKLGGRLSLVARAVVAAAVLAALVPAPAAGSAGARTWLARGDDPAEVRAAVAAHRDKLPRRYAENLRYVHDDGTIRVMVALTRRSPDVESFVERATRALNWYGDDPRFYANVDQEGFADLLGHPAVAFVEPDYPLSYFLAGSVVDVNGRGPNGLWGFSPDNGAGELSSNVPGLTADAATGKGVTVAVVDSGIDKTHQDFGGWGCDPQPYQPCESRILRSVVIDQVGGTGNDTGDALPTTEIASGHGTHVAGIVAGNGWYARRGETDPELYGGDGYTFGMAPQASLVSVKVGDGPSAALGSDALQWTLDHAEELGIRVANNSWGCSSGCEFNPESVLAQIQEDLYEAGVLTVFAAGNGGGEGGGAEFSGRSQSPYVLSVASYDDETDALSSFSSRGVRGTGLAHPEIWTPESEETAARRPDIAAPGDYIWSAASLTGGYASIFPRVDPADVDQQPGIFAYTSMGGTSMAAPHVSGAGALLFGACPNARPLDVMRSLMAGADPDKVRKTASSTTAEPFEAGYGALDVRASLEWLLGRPACDALGAGTIEGTVVDARNHEPVAGALISCPGIPDGFSDIDGVFRMDEVPAQTYACTVRAGGFTPRTKTVTVSIGKTSVLDFRLKAPKKKGRG